MNSKSNAIFAFYSLAILCSCEKAASGPERSAVVAVDVKQTTTKEAATTLTPSSILEEINRLKDPIAKVVQAKKQIQSLAVGNLAGAVEIANGAMDWMEPDVIALSFQRACKYPGTDFSTQFSPYLNSLLKSNLAGKLKEEIISRYVKANAGSAVDMEKVISLAESLHRMSPELLAQIYQDYAGTDPVRAVALLSTKKWNNDLQKATTVAYATFAMEDAIKASELIKNQKGSESYDWAVAGLYQVIRSSDPESAKVWRAEIQNPDAQSAADAIRYSIQIKR